MTVLVRRLVDGAPSRLVTAHHLTFSIVACFSRFANTERVCARGGGAPFGDENGLMEVSVDGVHQGPRPYRSLVEGLGF